MVCIVSHLKVPIQNVVAHRAGIHAFRVGHVFGAAPKARGDLKKVAQIMRDAERRRALGLCAVVRSGSASTVL